MLEVLQVHPSLWEFDLTPIRSQPQTHTNASNSHLRQPGLPVANQLQPQSSVLQARLDNSPQMQQEIENETLQKNKFEATKLGLQAKSDTITLLGQERLTVLQAQTKDVLQ